MPHRGRRAQRAPHDDDVRGRSGVRGIPGEHLVEHARERVEVAPEIHRLAAGLLRRHVLRGADRGADVGELLARRHGRPGDAEVGEPSVSLRQENVLGLDVAVDHVVAVGVLQGIGDSAGDAHRVADGQPAFAPQPVAQRSAFYVGHDVPEASGILAGVVNGQDVRVIEPGGELDLAEKASGRHAGGKLGVHELERHRAGVPQVLHQVHRRHAAAAELALEAVAGGEGGPEGSEIGRQGSRRRWLTQG